MLTILGKIFCTRLRSRMRGIFRSRFIYRRASAYSKQVLECDPDFSVRIFWSEHQFVRLQEKNVIKIFWFARSRSSIGATNSLAFKEPMRSRFFCSRFCERASIRSPSETISTQLSLWPGENLDGAVTIFGSGPGWN